MSDTVARHVVVSGRVQGIGYRDSCRHQAQQHGVTGWVRNRADGTVEAHLEGPLDAVDAVLRWCRQGPRWAEVTDCVANDTGVEGSTHFEVR